MNHPNLPSDNDIWAPLRATTPARIGLGRAGNSLPTRRVLEFQAAHAAARDAVHDPLDVDGLIARLHDIGIDEPLRVLQPGDLAQRIPAPARPGAQPG